MSSVEQKIREEIQQTLLKHTKTNFTKQLADIIDEATQALLQIIESDVIGAYECHSAHWPFYRTKQILAKLEPLKVRDDLREQQRANLREDK